MKKCAIIGGSSLEARGEDVIDNLKDFGAWCAEQGIELITGACDGYPYIIGKACVDAGGKVMGYSPAANLDDHVDNFKSPVDGCSNIRFLKNPVTDRDQRFLLRSFPLVEDADIIISVDGNWGTLYELTTAVISGKRILVLSNSRGISGGFEMLYSYMAVNCFYDYGESVEFFQSVEEVKAELTKWAAQAD